MRALWGLAVVAACSGSGDLQDARESTHQNVRPDVVFITLDTTRADRLGCYGYAQAKTPHLDGLARRGRRYARAYSPIALTIPSHAAMFTGRYPAALGLRSNGDGRLEDSEVTLAERLKEHGWRTAGSVTAFVTTQKWGFGQGFDAFFDPIDTASRPNFWHAERIGGEAVDDALTWLAEVPHSDPAFLWVHLYDPHFPYNAPSPFREAQPTRPYDAEIAYADHQVGRLITAFTQRDRPTLYVVVGDHGEGLGEHGELTHGLYVYDATQHVPFILSGPGVAPEVIENPVSLVDVLPTLLHALKLPPAEGIDGQVMPGSPPRPLYLESYQLRQRFGIAPHVGVVSGEHKLINTPQPELYALGSDPGEETNLADDDTERVQSLKQDLAMFSFEDPSQAPPMLADPEVALQLQALGYMESGFVQQTAGELEDPKAHRRLIGLSQRAERKQYLAERDEAESILRTLITEYPDVLEFQNRLATLLARRGERDEAAEIVRAALLLSPDNPALTASLGTFYAKNGQYKQASEQFQRAAEQMTYSPRLRAMAVASLLSIPGEEVEGVRLGLRYLEDYPDDYAVAGVVGVEFARKGVPKADALLELGAKAERPERDVAYWLANIAAQRGDFVRARQLFQRELDHHPNSVTAGRALLSVYAREQSWIEQADLAEAMLEQEPEDPALWHAKAQAEFNAADYARCRETLAEALERFPDHASLMLLDANLMHQEGDVEGSAARFEEAKAARAAGRP